MKVKAEWIVQPELARELALFTMRLKPKTQMNLQLWTEMLTAEHSILYPILIKLTCTDIPYRTHVHFIRHKIGFLPYVTTTRPDLTGKPQSEGDLVDCIFIVNPVSLITIARKRLCGRAAPKTRELMMDIKMAVNEDLGPYGKALAEAMVPNCVYRQKCTEGRRSCGYWKEKF
jgi:hypothetical protein